MTIREELLTLTPAQIQALMPFFWVTVASLVGTVFCATRRFVPKWPVFWICFAGLAMGIYAAFQSAHTAEVLLFNSMMVMDGYTAFFSVLVLGSALLTILGSMKYLDQEDLQYPEYYLLVLFSAIGMMLMAASTHLLILFIALELMSLSVYVLVSFRRADRKCNEGAMKYFILGGAASCIMLYGAALLYGATGTLDLGQILEFIQGNKGALTPLFAVGSWLVVIGFLFKVASVPFHMWMPDVYEGAPTPITGFMTTGLKAASFAAFLRFFISLGYGTGLSPGIESSLHTFVAVSAVATMIVGNVIALSQTSLKRMLAYSSIAHTGYIMLGLIAGSRSDLGYSPVLQYLFVYSVMNIGAFMVLTALSVKNDAELTLADLSGAARRRPWLGFAMAIFMFSMAGIPPTGGFVAKYYLFYAAVQAGETSLVVIGVLCSAISVYYYLRVLVAMYMKDPVRASFGRSHSVLGEVVIAVTLFLTLQLGIMPRFLLEWANQALSAL